MTEDNPHTPTENHESVDHAPESLDVILKMVAESGEKLTVGQLFLFLKLLPVKFALASLITITSGLFSAGYYTRTWIEETPTPDTKTTVLQRIPFDTPSINVNSVQAPPSLDQSWIQELVRRMEKENSPKTIFSVETVRADAYTSSGSFKIKSRFAIGGHAFLARKIENEMFYSPIELRQESSNSISGKVTHLDKNDFLLFLLRLKQTSGSGDLPSVEELPTAITLEAVK